MVGFTSLHVCPNLCAGFVAVDENKKHSEAERSLKQALHQLTHLHKVWQDVLPTTVYCKAIGRLSSSSITWDFIFLANTCVNHIMTSSHVVLSSVLSNYRF